MSMLFAGLDPQQDDAEGKDETDRAGDGKTTGFG
jgi:hypothetical protein